MNRDVPSDCQKTYPAESFGGKNSVKGNRHTEPQRGVSERNRRKAAALSAEMGSLSRSITRRSDQNCKIILQILILQFCRQLVKKVLLDFFDKLKKASAFRGCFLYLFYHRRHKILDRLAHLRMMDDKMDRRGFPLGDHRPLALMQNDL